MLAVKLHKRTKPNLEKGSFLVPVRTWSSGRKQVMNWMSLLNHCNRGRPNNCIRYITLVKIPDDHPVFIGLDWVDKIALGVEFVELAKIDATLKDGLDLIPSEKRKLRALRACHCITGADVPGDLIADCPELILGRRLPPRHIKWTKDIRLLYGTSRKPSARGGGDECDD